ncbi:Uncharacterised protein [Capnocytophaga ochracea]|uniref:Lipocalin-like domain-containing protein n=1 Tax=Capnocytophaga ochracea TaxID=1018 RepID=A0A2X2RGZ9_CAPOC|nr:lipocalin family protein [Capnocytophaga ochracea]SQA78514.1 Uncharacterised protein [Capnocytophaga ochracea]
MKKIFTLAFLALTLLVSACGKSNNDNPNPTPQDDTKKALIGTWYLVSSNDAGEDVKLTECNKKSHIIITEDQFINVGFHFKKSTGDCIKQPDLKFTYSISNNTLLLTSIEKKKIVAIFSISGNNLILKILRKKDDGQDEIIQKDVYIKRNS